MGSHFHDKPLFAFDWDDVIANRDHIRAAIRELFLLAGTHPDVEQRAYDKVKSLGGYNFRNHLREILHQHPHLVSASPVMYRAYREAMERLSHEIYTDAERFIVRLHGRFGVAIVTTGDPEHQQQKVARSGLDKYIQHMIFIPQRDETMAADKSRALGQLAEMYPKIFFFEDRPQIIRHVHDEHGKHGRIIPIRVDRKLETSLKYPNIIRHFDEFDVDKWTNSE
jgi:phosphoglycolate phosphatase-like HAD superfamily hydrolase